jgi:hypothetical protein
MTAEDRPVVRASTVAGIKLLLRGGLFQVCPQDELKGS